MNSKLPENVKDSKIIIPDGLRIRKIVIDVLSKDVKTEVNDDSQ